jgi:streptomycin 6-kinase
VTLIEAELLKRLHEYAREWGVAAAEPFETGTSVIAFGIRKDQPVVLKVIKQTVDEWRAGEVLAAFAEHGVVRVYKQVPGAVLVERSRPGNSLAGLALGGRDEEATDILAGVMQRMSACSSTSQFEFWPTVHDWARGFERYLTSGDEQTPRRLVVAGQRAYLDLCASQREPRLLHGDLQHYNVLFDSDRGWLAIDPKGVIGELEYEVGAALRNPYEHPELFISRSAIERRIEQFTNKLNLNYERTLRWAFAQAVLSAIWLIEDGFAVNEMTPALRLAEVLRSMLAAEDGNHELTRVRLRVKRD